jgi:hypothetical protein
VSKRDQAPLFVCGGALKPGDNPEIPPPPFPKEGDRGGGLLKLKIPLSCVTPRQERGTKGERYQIITAADIFKDQYRFINFPTTHKLNINLIYLP